MKKALGVKLDGYTSLLCDITGYIYSYLTKLIVLRLNKRNHRKHNTVVHSLVWISHWMDKGS